MPDPTFLRPTPYFDFEHPLVREFVELTLQGVQPGEVQRVRALYLAARDGVSYNPYVFDTDKGSMRASDVLIHRKSYCIPKAVLLGAAARSIGIPARLGLTNVRNHLSTPKMLTWLRTEVFAMHGYIELFVEGMWRKATPAFDRVLCERMGVPPLEFNGLEDSMFQQFSSDGSQFIEYLRDHGRFEDVPIDLILASLTEHYPHIADESVIQRFRMWDREYRAATFHGMA
ncbi:MAG: transglutaminase-like putative cysteine protease [Polyangiales bacterium]|jgi:transglutaminase-like putative cysteine protease